MARKPPPGLFITGTDTNVGKTHVTAMIARSLVAAGYKVGVYKPVASGCDEVDGMLSSDDALLLWQAAGCPGTLDRVCPQRFAAPLAPHLAARVEGRTVDAALLRSGVEYWRERSDFVLVEGAGGLMSPVTDHEYVADLAADLGYPLIVVAANRIGVINQVLQTLIVAENFSQRNAQPKDMPTQGSGHGTLPSTNAGNVLRGVPALPAVAEARRLRVAGVILNVVELPIDDPSISSNATELRARMIAPLLADVSFQDRNFAKTVDWRRIAESVQ